MQSKEINLKTNWDYSSLANAYLARPQYSMEAIDSIFAISEVKQGDKTCDVGAGVGHLTKHHLRLGLDVTAVEPNDEMRKLGILETDAKCDWVEGTGEETKQAEGKFKLVTFGSSFNVCDRPKALIETHRILIPGGWFACLWNHRDLEDPTQKNIEDIIKKYIPEYGYGARREDQTDIISQSNLFKNTIQVQSRIVHSQTVEECVEAWRSHATLERQAGKSFVNIIDEISSYLRMEFDSEAEIRPILIPYQTSCWIAQTK